MAQAAERPPTTFMSLPPELRYKIYDLACIPTQPINLILSRLEPRFGDGWFFQGYSMYRAYDQAKHLKQYSSMSHVSRAVHDDLEAEFFHQVRIAISYSSYGDWEDFRDPEAWKKYVLKGAETLLSKARNITVRANSWYNRQSFGDPIGGLEFHLDGTLKACKWTIDAQRYIQPRRRARRMLKDESKEAAAKRAKKAAKWVVKLEAKCASFFTDHSKPKHESIVELMEAVGHRSLSGEDEYAWWC